MRSSLLLLLVAVALVRSANAGAYPDKPVRFIVPFSAGAAADGYTLLFGAGGTSGSTWRRSSPKPRCDFSLGRVAAIQGAANIRASMWSHARLASM